MGAQDLILYSVLLCIQMDTNLCFISTQIHDDRSMCSYGNDSSRNISTTSEDCLFNNDTSELTGDHALLVNEQLRKFSQKGDLREFLGTCDFNAECHRSDVCKCDSLCGSYGDCCIDTRTVDRSQSTIPYIRYMSCVGGSVSKGEYGLVMISKCPESFQNYSSCEQVDIFDVSTFVPVIGDNNMVYRNKYCALCHGEPIKDYMKLEISGCGFESGKVNEISPWVLLQICENAIDCSIRYTYLYPVMYFRQCIPTPRVICPLSKNVSMTPLYNTLRQKCLSHFNPYTYADVDYRNVYCSVCEIGIPEGLEYIYCTSMFPIYQFFSMTWLFDINPEKLHVETLFETECGPEEIFLPFLKQCVELQCPRYATKNGRACNKQLYMPSDLQNYKLICMKVTGELDLLMSFNTFRLAKNLMFNRKDISFTNSWKICDNETTYICETFNVINEHRFVEYEGVDSESYFGQQLEVIYKSDTSSETTTYKLASSQEIALQDCIEDMFPPMLPIEGFVCRPSLDTLSTSTSSISGVNDNVFNCYKDFLTLNDTEIGNVRNAKPTNDSEKYSMEKLKTYLTLGCLTISVLSSVVCILRKKRILLNTTLPKKLLFNLMLIQIISNTLFILVAGANDVREICFVAGVILHYCWLSSYFWTTVYTFHLYYTFVISIRFPALVLTMNRSTNRRLFIKYSMIGYIAPLAIVIPTVVLDLSYGHELDYYGGKICFLATKEAVVFCFFIPVTMSYILNIFCFIFTNVFVKGMQFKIDSWKKSFKTNIKIVLKMSILMAWTWIFGFMASLLQNDVLWIIFVCSHGLQGFFLSWINGFVNIKSCNSEKLPRSNNS